MLHPKLNKLLFILVFLEGLLSNLNVPINLGRFYKAILWNTYGFTNTPSATEVQNFKRARWDQAAPPSPPKDPNF